LAGGSVERRVRMSQLQQIRATLEK